MLRLQSQIMGRSITIMVSSLPGTFVLQQRHLSTIMISTQVYKWELGKLHRIVGLWICRCFWPEFTKMGEDLAHAQVMHRMIQKMSVEYDQFVTDRHFPTKSLKPVKNKRLNVMVCFMIYCEGFHWVDWKLIKNLVAMVTNFKEKTWKVQCHGRGDFEFYI